MERDDMSKFTNSVILISKLLTMTEDRFLKHKLHGKISDFVSAFVEDKNIRSPDIVQHNMSHNMVCQNLLNSINNLLDCLEYSSHISKDDAAPPLLAQINLLKFKLHVLKCHKAEKVSKTSLASAIENLTSGVLPVNSSLSVSKSSVKNRIARLSMKSDSNKERIFNFIRKTQEVRAKDIMNKFNVLSSRTVKRNLKELTDQGFIKKIFEGGAVYYTCG